MKLNDFTKNLKLFFKSIVPQAHDFLLKRYFFTFTIFKKIFFLENFQNFFQLISFHLVFLTQIN